MERALILVTNDDGVASPALEVLVNSLLDIGEVWVFAPDREQSAVGHGVSLHRPLRAKKVRERWYMIDGTPTDCVLLAVRALLPRPPSAVVSGINTGPNLGDDVTYSGTVAGAYEGMLLGFPSVAISNGGYEPTDYQTAGRVARRIVQEVLERGLPPDTVLNVNVPDVVYDELKGVRITRQGLREFDDEIVARTDPRGNDYYWIGGLHIDSVGHPGTDMEAVKQGYVSVTPLHRNLTNADAFMALQEWNLAL
jgi:5'-nucleotidase